MNSITSQDLTTANVALEAAKCLREIHVKARKVVLLEKELEEINLSISAYIEESRKNLEQLILSKANEATSSQEVVDIISSNTCKNTTMSSYLTSKKSTKMTKTATEDNYIKIKSCERQQARSFIAWYKHMIDNDRQNLGLYLSDNAILEWFGRTIKNRKKVSSFLKHDIQCTRHNFTTIESIENIQLRSHMLKRKEDSILPSPQTSPELIKCNRPGKRKLFDRCSSPEWAEGCQPDDEGSTMKKHKDEKEYPDEKQCISRKRLFSDNEEELNSKGDGILGKSKRNCIEESTVTPPFKELGQGDCLPSTSRAESSQCQESPDAQPTKLAVECNGYIEFMRSKNNRCIDTMKWERKCKVQISYSKDPLNVGEYVIWVLQYTDETKCRRNLLASFEEVASQEPKHV